MTHSVAKKLLTAAAIAGAFASHNAQASETPLCGSTTKTGGALTIGQTECIAGNGLYFYLDVENDNTALELTTTGGTGEADIYISSSSWATHSNYTQNTNSTGTNDRLSVNANAGRLYVSIFGIHEQVTFSVSETIDDTNGESCTNPSSDNATLTIGETRCTKGNGLYFKTVIEEDGTPLTISTAGGTGEADIYVNDSSWATRNSYTAASANTGTEESLTVTANAGTFYISLMGIHEGVSLSLTSGNDDSGNGDGSGDNIPSLPANPGMCGDDTIVDQEITFNQIECVNVSSTASYATFIPADNTEITLSTAGGTGELVIYASQEGWARSDSYEFASSGTGTEQSVTFVANEGWLYVQLDANSVGASEVSFLVATDTSKFPTTGGGNDIPDDGLPTDATRFLGLNGADLVERIAISHPQNVSPIYKISGADATQVYSEANMIAIANAINTRAPGYTGTDTTGLQSLLYFLRGAYYVQFAHPEDVPEYTSAVTDAIATALRNLFNNTNTWIVSEENGNVLKEALITVDSAYLGAAFNDITIKVLNDYNADWKASFAMNAAANSVFTTLFRAQWDDSMKALFTEDDSILDALNNFQLAHRDAIGTDAEYVLLNAVNEMARLYHVDALFPRVKLLVKAVLDSTSKDDETKALWIKAASMSDYYDRADCGYYGICGFAYTLEAETLAFNYKCSDSLKIRAQHMYNDQAAWICQVLGGQESNFHEILATGYQPVSDDNNQALELVIFDSSEDYKTYAGQFFGIDTNNGGMYLEGAPINEKNQARFIAYEAEWIKPEFHVWNLQHEYVHYLDGRFDLYGDFQLGMTASTVWWTEGLGEYISQGDGNEYAISVGQSQEVTLSEIFNNTYDSGQTRVYRWGYLGVRFMFEEHRNDVNQMLNLTRTGQYPEYQTYLDNIGTSYDSEFTDWLVNGVVLGDSNIVELGPNDESSTASGTAGNWAGEPVTISTDFSPCVVNVTDNAYDAENNTVTTNQIIECINSSNGQASLVIANDGGLSTRFKLTTSGGWGNADIIFGADNWPSAQDNDGYANGDGNWDSLEVQLDPDVYWHYITLDGEFGGVELRITEQ
ncbi:collagenase [Colwellia sp. RSH04]|uniref:collagenase n=1 Tax=Colwellia sp. RSH04 TaxID=2305464 RepID=UPI0015FB0B9C|nr:collagenase [Colwellia sp. RSH04]